MKTTRNVHSVRYTDYLLTWAQPPSRETYTSVDTWWYWDLSSLINQSHTTRVDWIRKSAPYPVTHLQCPVSGSSRFGNMCWWKVPYQSVSNLQVSSWGFLGHGPLNSHRTLSFSALIRDWRQEDNFPSDITQSGLFHNFFGISTINNLVKATIGYTTAKLGVFFLNREWFGPWTEHVFPSPFVSIIFFSWGFGTSFPFVCPSLVGFDM